MVLGDHRSDMLSSTLDDGLNCKSPSYTGLESQFFEYNQISDAFNSFQAYDLPHHMSQSSPSVEFNALQLDLMSLPPYHQQAPMETSPVYTPMEAISPAMTMNHLHQSQGNLSPPMPSMSASDLSADGGAMSSHGSIASSPESGRGCVPLPPAHGRTPSSMSANSGNVRYNPLKAPGGRGGSSAPRAPPKKRVVKPKEEDSDDEEEEDYVPQPSAAKSSDKREEIRKQRIESEQRRRDELREGYRRLKDALPSSNQKSSKVSLLDRAVTHVRYMELTRQQLQVRLNAAEMETQRLRQVNEALMLGTAEQRAAAAAASAAVQAHVQSQY